MDIHDIDPPAFEPVDITYTKTFLRVDHDAEDALITDLITAARVRVEGLIRGSLPTRRRLYRSQKTDGGGLFINHSPVTDVHRVSVVSCDGEVTDVLETSYTVNYRTTPVTLHIWCWDARPYPAFPARSDVWSDGGNWQLGHWITGRTGLIPLADVIHDVSAQAGVSVDVTRVNGLLQGYVIDRPMSARAALEH